MEIFSIWNFDSCSAVHSHYVLGNIRNSNRVPTRGISFKQILRSIYKIVLRNSSIPTLPSTGVAFSVQTRST